MKLIYAPTSPYVRKALVVARELHLLDRLELVKSTASPIKTNESLNDANPLGKMPALVLDNGLTLFDSPVVCEYLASLVPGNGVFPTGQARWQALRDQALADGVMDAALLCRYELVRPEEKRWSEWTDGQMRKIMQALDDLESRASTWGDRVDIGTITIACALGFLAFRFASLGWEASRPALNQWFLTFSQRESIVATVPVA